MLKFFRKNKQSENEYNFKNGYFDKTKVIGGLLAIITIVAGVAGFIYWQNGRGLDLFSEKNKDPVGDLFRDSDGDKLTDNEEEIYGTDKNKIDSDDDGYNDYDEINNGYNPLGEGRLTEEEIARKKVIINKQKEAVEIKSNKIWQSSFIKKSGSDGGYKNIYERLADDDGDGLNNILEQAYGLNPRDSDTDRDGKADGYEIKNFENPLGWGLIDKEIVYAIEGVEDYLMVFDNCAQATNRNDALFDQCSEAAAVLTNKQSYCNNTKGGEVDGRGECFTRLATINIDEKYCENIPKNDEPDPFNDRNECFKKLALMKKNYKICNNIDTLTMDRSNKVNRFKESRYYCYAAASNGNVKICEEIKSNYKAEYKKYLIEDNFFRKESIDGIVNESVKEIENEMEAYGLCLENIATVNNDPSFCEKIKFKRINNRCYNEVAKHTKNYKICDKITSGNNDFLERDRCYGDVGETINDAKICDKIIETETKELCYENVGRHSADVSLCMKIKDAYKKDGCLGEVALKLKDANLCLKISNKSNHDSCIEKLLTTESDSSACSKIIDDDKRDLCFWKLADIKKDYRICDEIKNYISKESNYSCYTSVALELLDENICNLIPTIFNRNNCYNKIAIEKKDKNICDKIIKDENAAINIITKERCYNEIK